MAENTQFRKVNPRGEVFVGRPYSGGIVKVIISDEFEKITPTEKRPDPNSLYIQLIPKMKEEIERDSTVSNSAMARKFNCDRGTITKARFYMESLNTTPL